MFKKSTVIGFLLVPLALFFSTKILVDYLFIHKASAAPFFYTQPEKVWAHRGYFKTLEQNSINAYRKAFDLGARATELDIYYDVKMDDFVVSHDFPYRLKNGRLLMLEEVFKNFDNKKFYWLDFKNLKWLPEQDIRNAVLQLETLTDNYKIKDRIIIESENAKNLSPLSENGFNTSYWIAINEKKGQLNSLKQIYKLKIKYLLGYFSAVSMDYRNYTPELKKSLTGLPFLLFTVNDESMLNKFVQDDAVRITLTDENLYGLTKVAYTMQ